MNPNLSRALCLFITSLVLIVFISGCADIGEQGPQVQLPNHVENSEKETEPRYTMSWTMHQNAPVPEDAEMIAYIEDLFDVNLEVWNLENKRYEDLLDLELAQGNIPDLFRIRQPQDLLKYQMQGVLAEIPQDVLEEHAPNIVKRIRDYDSRYLEYGKIDGALYGVPVVNQTNIYRTPVVYRKDWLEQLGLDIPTTLEEFETVMYAFAKGDPDGNGKEDTYGLSKEGLNVVFGAFGQSVFTEQLYFNEKDNQLVIGALEPEMKQALAYLQKWYQDGIIDPEFITGENKGGYKHLSHAFIKGKIGMTSMGNYYHWTQDGDYSILNERGEEIPVGAMFNVHELLQKNASASIEFGPPVTGPDGLSGSKGYNLLMSFITIGADAANEPGKLEKILEILDYVSANSDPLEQIQMEHGLQGKHWDWSTASSGEFHILPPYNRMENYTNMIGSNIGMTVPGVPSGKREQWAASEGLTENGIYNQLQVATPALIQYSTELISMRDRAYISIITGDQPVGSFDTFVKDFLEAGGEQVLTEANEWYNGHMETSPAQ
ncbi:extracellular solute-binding protein [Paenibacillus xylanilyticus]|uniref:Extracellular solute-binding protein n=1 Tax=Paenibacillus xylanilyticus TaxID=248903 RepID=A0A7Y6BW89_9BACL|nr:extracellular solute-binding protein [Paenibacillus xylanilyticus]NUU76052.1 extracellular solute-binding protein [Paenibacillus xylanilyticus]